MALTLDEENHVKALYQLYLAEAKKDAHIKNLDAFRADLQDNHGKKKDEIKQLSLDKEAEAEVLEQILAQKRIDLENVILKK